MARVPSDVEKWRAVHSYVAKWSEVDDEGVSPLERALKQEVGAAREKHRRNACGTFLIVDA